MLAEFDVDITTTTFTQVEFFDLVATVYTPVVNVYLSDVLPQYAALLGVAYTDTREGWSFNISNTPFPSYGETRGDALNIKGLPGIIATSGSVGMWAVTGYPGRLEVMTNRDLEEYA